MGKTAMGWYYVGSDPMRVRHIRWYTRCLPLVAWSTIVVGGVAFWWLVVSLLFAVF